MTGRKKAGNTMVEVLVALVIVLLVMEMFTRVTGVSAGIMNRSSEMADRLDEFDEAYYLGEEEGTVLGALSLSGEDGTIPLRRGELRRFEYGGFARDYVAAAERP